MHAFPPNKKLAGYTLPTLPTLPLSILNPFGQSHRVMSVIGFCAEWRP